MRRKKRPDHDMTVKLLPDKKPVETWGELMELYGRYQPRIKGRLWVFRGQGSSLWKLETALERRIRHHAKAAAMERHELEGTLVREFQRKAHLYPTRLPRDSELVEWLALMRHHGAPTRLLDWTYSFFVAVYFACENADDECAVWALDSTWCRVESEQLLPELKSKATSPIHACEYARRSRREYNRLSRILGFSTKALAYPVNAFYMNERLTIQQGVFIWPGNIAQGFEMNLAALKPAAHDPVQKIRIARGAVDEILKELHRMNMSRATLYPGLDGFASSLNTRMAFPETLEYRQ